MRVNIVVTKVEDLFETLKLEENSVYKVLIKSNASNPAHISYLFTGFKNGNYCEIYNNTYERTLKLSGIYSLEVIKKLDTKKD